MAYLIAKFTLLFLLASLLSFLLGRWWARRSFVDVTESYQSLTKSSASDDGLWKSLWKRLDGIDSNMGLSVRNELSAIPAPPTVDLSGLQGQLDAVSKRIDGIRIPEAQETDLSAVLSRIDAVSKRIDGIRIPEPRQTDLSGVLSKLDAVSTRVDGIRIPDQRETDLSGLESQMEYVHNKLGAIRIPDAPRMPDLAPMTSRIASLETAIKNIPRPQAQPDVDLGPVTSRLNMLEQAVKAIPKPERQTPISLDGVNKRLDSVERSIRDFPKPVTVDLRPLSTRLTEVDQRIRRIKPAADVNIQPIERRLSAIEIELKKFRSVRVAAPAPTRKVERKKSVPRPKKAKRTSGPRLFTSATHGKKDDLKRISGVGPKLERLLNKNGVYYFWQVSEWSKKDIDVVDARLQVFKGRISRDNWVSQAKTLKRGEGAAKAPR